MLAEKIAEQDFEMEFFCFDATITLKQRHLNVLLGYGVMHHIACVA